MPFDAARLTRIDDHLKKYVDDGRLAGWQLVVGQHDEMAHRSHYGTADIEAGRPVADDTLWRIYSMTKPIVSVAAMVLWERGLFELTDEISRYFPHSPTRRCSRAGPQPRPSSSRRSSRSGCGTCSPTPAG